MTRYALAALAAVMVFAGLAPAQYSTGRVPPTPEKFAALKAEYAAKVRAGLVAETPPVAATEASWDSRAKGWIPPVQDQEGCGSCWLYTGKGVVEVAYIKAGKTKPDGSAEISAQQFLDCFQHDGCNGNDDTTFLKYAKKVGGVRQKDYGPYHARSERCHPDVDKLTRYEIDEWGFADGDAGYEQVGATQKIKDAIKNYGAVGVAIAADNAFMRVRPGEVFHGSNRGINHEVMLVGWDDAKKAWLLRNSWGTKWCDGGYCWIGWGANCVGTQPVWAKVAAKEPDPPAPDEAARPWLLYALAAALGVAVLGCVVLVLLRRKPPAA